jgi:serine protease Do
MLVGLMLCVGIAGGQSRPGQPVGLPDELAKSGSVTLQAFAGISESTRGSVVRLDVDGERAALGAVISADGLVLTKASEVKAGVLTCRLEDGVEVAARLLAVDLDNDVGLVRVEGQGLRPVVWTAADPEIGQWAVTPGMKPVPEAIGVISTARRRVPHQRALIGVELDMTSDDARISALMPGLGAEKAGLQMGDAILAVNDVPIGSREDLMRRLREYRDGQSVVLHVERAGAVFDATVTMLAPRVDSPARRADRQERMNRMGGELSLRADGFEEALTHDTVLQPWQCGGPLVNLDGEAIGLNIARAGRVASYALPAGLARRIAEELLRKSEGQEDLGRDDQPASRSSR